MNEIINITHLSYDYPDGHSALQDINLAISPGEKVALIGANGAGKSTLLLHLNGCLRGAGKITVDGHELNNHTLKTIRSLVGVVFDNPDNQLFSSTVYEDVAYGLVYQGLDSQTIERKVNKTLTALGMESFADHSPYHLSMGEKRRIALATVLSMDPKILVLDEPTAGLDPKGKKELIALLEGLDRTMLISTHDLDMAKQVTSRTIIIDRGKITATGETLEILSDEPLLIKNGIL